MAGTYHWFATNKDMPQIFSWLRDAGALPLNGRMEVVDSTVPREEILHFSQFGPIQFWPEKVDLGDFKAGSPEWKRAALARIRQTESPHHRIVDEAASPTAMLLIPYQRDQHFWTTGELHFTAPNIAKAFPDLAKVSSNFGRWLARNELVFDHSSREFKGNPFNPYAYNLGIQVGIVRKIYAFPDALAVLKSGSVMIGRELSPGGFEDFKRTLRLRGVDC